MYQTSAVYEADIWTFLKETANLCSAEQLRLNCRGKNNPEIAHQLGKILSLQMWHVLGNVCKCWAVCDQRELALYWMRTMFFGDAMREVAVLLSRNM